MVQNNGDKVGFLEKRQTYFVLNIITVISIMVVLGMVVLYLFEGRAQNEEAIQTGKDAKFQAELTKNQSVQNGRNIDKLNQSFVAFVDNFYDRQKIGNERANKTIEGFNNLTMYLKEVLKLQLLNEETIIGNLTQHRVIQNITRDDDERRQNETLATLQDIENSTQTLITQFNETNEEERGKAVDRIINNLTAVIREQLSNKTR